MSFTMRVARGAWAGTLLLGLVALSLGACKTDLGLESVVFQCETDRDCSGGYVCQIAAGGICVAEGGDVIEPPLGGHLLLDITSDAPGSGAALEQVRVLLSARTADGFLQLPIDPEEAFFNPPVGPSFDPVVAVARFTLDLDSLPAGFVGATVVAHLTGRVGGRVVTAWIGTIDETSETAQTLHLRAVAAECDADGDGFLDCMLGGCCEDPTVPLSDCAPGVASANPWQTEDPCAQCGDGIDQDCSGGDEPCVDLDADGVADCLEVSCGLGNGKVAPGLAERCDGLDNDCDGATDEGFELEEGGAVVVVGGTCGLGACAGGLLQCSADELGVLCTTAGLAAAFEACGDEVDDDCDGQTDEQCSLNDVDGDGVTPEMGDCNDHDSGFFPGAPEPCCPRALQGQPGVLAACDRNCDKEAVFCTEDDVDGDGVPGMLDCDDADPQVYPGAPEKCGDGVDQDCSGADLPCTGLMDNDGDGFSPPDDCNDAEGTIHPGAVETCNATDDDCDSMIDEGNPDTGGGEACGEDEGACAPGKRVCVNTSAAQLVPGTVVCLGGVLAADETCDGTDEDCDGATDEGFFWSGLAVGASCDGDGSCGAGLVECVTAGEALCSTNPGGSEASDTVESCNGKDDDCDGTIDEALSDFAASSCISVGVCGTLGGGGALLAKATCRVNPATPEDSGWDCDYSAVPGYEAAVELSCDGLDNDCDGKTDDEFNVGKGCDGPDEDSCANGVWACVADEKAELVCDESQAALVVELCDELDNDCDDATDEDFQAGGTVVFDGGPWAGDAGKVKGEVCGTGACAEGSVVCALGVATALTCSSLGLVEAEVCNGLDDDCDSQTDEGLGVGEDCGVGACAGGALECADTGGVRCDSMPVGATQGEAGSSVKASVEECNGVDDDCDGKTDEALTSTVDAGCETAGVCGLEGVASASCVEGGWVCQYASDSWSAEGELGQCDLLDNDCDGTTDEEFVAGGTVSLLEPDGVTVRTLGQSCGLGACATGSVVCGPGGQTLLCTTADKAVSELCNGLDDDCDGLTDEAPVTVSAAACDPDGACGEAGGLKLTCVAGKTLCTYTSASYQADDEAGRCDAVDNDCDGGTDEDFGAAGTVVLTEPDGATVRVLGELCGLGACAGGSVECSPDGAALVCTSAAEAGTDLCDGADGDCDGAIDEAFKVGGEFPLAGALLGADDGKWLGDDCGTGACAGGTVLCGSEDALGCSSSGLAGVETCNGVDDDCDGLTDEDFKAGGAHAYDGGPFIGDAGRTLGADCGVGVCSGGEVICDPADSSRLTCSGLVAAGPEECNGEDEDCNGFPDDPYLSGGTKTFGGGPFGADAGKPLGESCGTGGCAGGTVVCGTTESLTCSTLVQATAEACNEADDDCDGNSDEDFIEGLGQSGWLQPYSPFQMRFLGDSCGTGPCHGGTVQCAPDGGLVCPTMELAEANDLTCDTVDNDCNGITDDNFAAGGEVTFVDWDGGVLTLDEPCGTGQCAGTVACDDEQSLTCSGSPPSASDAICDGIDSDCNGATDEDYVEKGCDGDDEDSCSRGFKICTEGEELCVDDTPCPESRPQCVEGTDANSATCACVVVEGGSDSCQLLGPTWSCSLPDGMCKNSP